MKRFLAVCVLAVSIAFTAASFTPASAQSLEGVAQVKWRTSAANTNGFVDSLTASINGAFATVDTTAWLSTADWDWQKGSTGSTIHGCARLFLNSTLNTSCDTLFVAIEGSLDGSNAQVMTSTTFLNVLPTASTDEGMTLPLVCDGDAAWNGTGGNIWLMPYIRFRVRADGNTAALFANARLTVIYPVFRSY